MNVLRFKLKQNVMFNLGGDTPLFMAPHKTKRLDLMETHGISAPAMLSVFDLEHVHELTLPDIEPRVPRRRPEWDDDFYKVVATEAFRETVDRRRAADELRQRIAHYIARGVIEIVADDSDFMSDTPVSSAELTAAKKPSK